MKRSNLFKFIVLPIVVIVLIGGGLGSFAYFGNFSEGNRTGYVVKLSKKGFLMKTYEGQIDVETFGQSKTTPISTLWDFSVEEKQTEVLKMLDSAMVNRVRVKLEYEEKFYRFAWRGDTKYLVTKVVLLK